MLGEMKEIGEIRSAVVGTGFIGAVHAEALRRLGVEVLGVVGSSPERAAAKRPPGVRRAYESLEAMLADPDVDVVHITSPNAVHAEQVKAVLEAGKHVVCEKPLSVDSGSTAELVRLARASGLVHAVNFNVRFYALAREARERVAAGAVGDVRLVSGSYLQDWLLYEDDWNWRLEADRAGPLRAVADIGSHWIDLVGFVTGRRVTAVMADLATFIPVRRRPQGSVETFANPQDTAATVPVEVSSDDAALLILQLEGGARGALTVSQVSPGRKNQLRFELAGADASLAWDSERAEELWIGHRDRPNESLLRDPSLLSVGAATLPGGHTEGFENTFKELFRAIYRDVAAGGPAAAPDYPTFEDGHEQALIADAISTSARERRWVDVDRTPAMSEV